MDIKQPYLQAHFDIAAAAYDSTFTNSQIGRIQRRRVWNYLDKSLPQKALRVLELNCGTGQDALFLANLGHTVIATDISKEMIKTAQAKIDGTDKQADIEVCQLDITQLKMDTFTSGFDLVLSNFGGLNCLNGRDLEKLTKVLPHLLSTNGRVISVVMPPYNWMESLYFFVRLEWKKIFRRKTFNNKSVDVNVDGIKVPTWYYNPKHFASYFQDSFSTEVVQPVSFLPSFFENIVSRFPFLLKVDNFLYRLGAFANISDHYLIDLKKK